MKKIIVLIIIILSVNCSFSQVKKSQNTLNENGQKKQIDEDVVYKLFPTQNMWNFIKLDTRSGQMWQVQFGLEKKTRFVTNLNTVPLNFDNKEINGRFTLYPTQNTWNFILIDQLEGSTWQVQWSTEADSRSIMPIE